MIHSDVQGPAAGPSKPEPSQALLNGSIGRLFHLRKPWAGPSSRGFLCMGLINEDGSNFTVPATAYLILQAEIRHIRKADGHVMLNNAYQVPGASDKELSQARARHG